MMLSVFIVAVIGFCISLYTYLLEEKVKRNPEYKPACDISDRISCTKPMKSVYANLFYFSNALLGIAFYVLVAILALLEAHKLLVIAALCGCIVTCIFAYILYFKVKSLCLLCTSLYIINFILLYLSFKSI